MKRLKTLFLPGPALAADHTRCSGEALSAEEIVALAEQPSGARSSAAHATLQRHAERLARGLAHVVNLLDPAVVVLGGGLSNMAHLYAQVPLLMRKWIFADDRRVDIRAPRYGDASGARGAARLWQQAHPPSQ